MKITSKQLHILHSLTVAAWGFSLGIDLARTPTHWGEAAFEVFMIAFMTWAGWIISRDSA